MFFFGKFTMETMVSNFRVEAELEVIRRFAATEGLIELANMPKQFQLSPQEMLTNRYTMESLYASLPIVSEPVMEGFNPFKMIWNAIKGLFKFIGKICSAAYNGMKKAFAWILNLFRFNKENAKDIEKLESILSQARIIMLLRKIKSKDMQKVFMDYTTAGANGEAMLKKLIQDLDDMESVKKTMASLEHQNLTIGSDTFSKVTDGSASDEEKLLFAIVLAIASKVNGKLSEYSHLVESDLSFIGKKAEDFHEINLVTKLSMRNASNPSPIKKTDLEDFNMGPFIHNGIFKDGAHPVNEKEIESLFTEFLKDARAKHKIGQKADYLSTLVGAHGAMVVTSDEPDDNGIYHSAKAMVYGGSIMNEAEYSQSKGKFGDIRVYPAIDMAYIDTVADNLKVACSDEYRDRLAMYQDDIKTIGEFTNTFDIEAYKEKNPDKKPGEILHFLKLVDSWRWFISHYYDFQLAFIYQYSVVGKKSMSIYQMLVDLIEGKTSKLTKDLDKLLN